MTVDKKFKRAVRARAKREGVSYSEAHRRETALRTSIALDRFLGLSERASDLYVPRRRIGGSS